MSEQSVASAKATVMLYDDSNKKWIPSGATSGFSKVHLYQHTVNNTFRIVGRKLQDHELVINCAIVKGLKYNQATPIFHQWRDRSQVYGLSFSNKDDAENFASAITHALEILAQNNTSNHRSSHQNQSHQNQSNYQMPGGVSLDEYAEYRGGRMNTENGDWKVTTPEYAAYSPTTANHSSHPTTPGSTPSPSAYGHHRTSSAPLNAQPLTMPQQPSYQILSPPPPPPPPPTGNMTGSVTLPRQNSKTVVNQGPNPVSLASALATAKLKKTQGNGKGPDIGNGELKVIPPIGGMASMMDEMARTLARRRAQAENQDRESIGSNDSGKQIYGNNLPSPCKNAGGESPRSCHRSQLDFSGDVDKQMISVVDMERIKQEIMSDVRTEIIKAKQEIIEAFREFSRR